MAIPADGGRFVLVGIRTVLMTLMTQMTPEP